MIVPINNTQDTADCNLYEDVLNYPDLLQDNSVVSTFMELYPEAITTTNISITETGPLQAKPSYTYEYGNGTSIILKVHVRGCITDIVKYNFEVFNDGTRDTYQIWNVDEAITFLNGFESPPSYKIHENWINLRGQIVSVFVSSVDKLIEREYLISRVT